MPLNTLPCRSFEPPITDPRLDQIGTLLAQRTALENKAFDLRREKEDLLAALEDANILPDSIKEYIGFLYRQEEEHLQDSIESLSRELSSGYDW